MIGVTLPVFVISQQTVLRSLFLINFGMEKDSRIWQIFMNNSSSSRQCSVMFDNAPLDLEEKLLFTDLDILKIVF